MSFNRKRNFLLISITSNFFSILFNFAYLSLMRYRRFLFRSIYIIMINQIAKSGEKKINQINIVGVVFFLADIYYSDHMFLLFFSSKCYSSNKIVLLFDYTNYGYIYLYTRQRICFNTIDTFLPTKKKIQNLISLQICRLRLKKKVIEKKKKMFFRLPCIHIYNQHTRKQTYIL